MRKFKLNTIIDNPFFDIVLIPFIFIAAKLLLAVRRIGFLRLKYCKRVLLKVGVMPIINHYYEPLFDKNDLVRSLSEVRSLPGIKWNTRKQLSLLDKFHYSNELIDIPDDYQSDTKFHFNNGTFEHGDAEYWYNIIRHTKPKTIIEIGSGNSTKIAALAIRKNIEESDLDKCEHICIEPYEMPWLEDLGIAVIREKVETVDRKLFSKLKSNDILFIDSSHMIRPQGDVLYEYLELLPTLNKGVIVHIHDIFSPKDYPKEWVLDMVRFWNEQYLLEAFMTSNNKWEIIGALNYLHDTQYKNFKDKFPLISRDISPGSFYIKKTS